MRTQWIRDRDRVMKERLGAAFKLQKEGPGSVARWLLALLLPRPTDTYALRSVESHEARERR